MSFFLIQFMEGLASASSLFLVAAGLSLIFGVTRIINFAHGSLYMLGAYMAWTLSAPLGFWLAVPLAALITALAGILLECSLLRRIYRAPELFQLLATFAVTLIAEDMVSLLWGPDDMLGPRAPGLKGSVDLFGHAFPAYDLFLIAVGPAVMAGLWLLLKGTRFGILVRAASADREMLAALGVDQTRLFTAVFALGALLAGLGGALELPRAAIHPAMGTPVVVSAFVVVVVGGLGSLPGAFLAALLIGELSAFGVYLWPKATLVLMFAVMALVLALRPRGLMGKSTPDAADSPAGTAPMLPSPRLWAGLALTGLFFALVPLAGDAYATTVASEILIMALFAASLSLVTALGGMTCFGQAAWFGIGAYAVALAHPALGMEGALLTALLAGFLGGWCFARPAVRHAGITLAMLTLALAAIIHSLAMQLYGLTGGDNGILGIWPSDWAASPETFHLFVLAIVGLAFVFLWRLAASPFGFAARAVRDQPARAEAIGIDSRRTRALAFAIGAALAALAGGLFAYLKGSVFPDTASIATSVDALVMLLLGGIGSLAGPILGAGLHTLLKVGLSSHSDLWRMAVGAILILLVVGFPGGLLGRMRRP